MKSEPAEGERKVDGTVLADERGSAAVLGATRRRRRRLEGHEHPTCRRLDVEEVFTVDPAWPHEIAGDETGRVIGRSPGEHPNPVDRRAVQASRTLIVPVIVDDPGKTTARPLLRLVCAETAALSVSPNSGSPW